jgi:UDP-N-acetylglucosamine 2-epimerase (non-hydrolysing)
MTRRICIIAGTRPEAIKLAPLINLLRNDRRFTITVAVTGQHTKMLDQAFEFFGITPDLQFSVMESAPDLLQLTENIVGVMARLLHEAQPELAVVQGDTTTAMLAALASFYSHIPIAHVEAGLRSFSRSLPFPEEINRRMISVLSDLNFAPTQGAKANLIAEGIPEQSITVTGNTVIDALLRGVARSQTISDPLLKPIETWSGPIILVTAHRRESWGQPMDNIAMVLDQLSTQRPDVLIVLPMHRNPLVRRSLATTLTGKTNVILTDPLDYGDLCTVLNASTLVLTDSGGIQEEAPSLGKPVLVLRTTTERPEGIASGNALLVGTSPSDILRSVDMLLDDPAEYKKMSTRANPYGDGKASQRITQAIANYFSLSDPPTDFNSDETEIHIAPQTRAF